MKFIVILVETQRVLCAGRPKPDDCLEWLCVEAPDETTARKWADGIVEGCDVAVVEVSSLDQLASYLGEVEPLAIIS